MDFSVRSYYAIVQTGVLVLAVVGGTATVAGPAAAAARDLTVTSEGQDIQPNGNLTFEVTDDVGVDDHNIHVWIDSHPANGTFDPGERNVTLETSNGETASGTFPDVDLAPGTYTVMAVESDSLEAGAEPQTRANFSVDITPPGLDTAVAFTEANGTQAYGDVGDTVVEVVFNDSLSDGSGGTAPAAGDVLVKFTNGTIVNPTFDDGGTGDAHSDRRVVLFLGNEVSPAKVQAVGVNKSATFTDTAGNPVNPHIDPVTSATTTVAETGSNKTAFDGEFVAVVGDQDDEEVFMRNSNESTVFNETTGLDSRVFAWNSTDSRTDVNYRVFFDGRTNPHFLLREDVGLDLRNLGLTVTADKPQYTTDEPLTATVTAIFANRSVVTRLLSNGSVEATRTTTLNGTEATVTFGTRMEGDYRIEVEDNATGLTDVTGLIRVEAPATPTATPTVTPTGTPVLTPTPTPMLTSSPDPTRTGRASPTATATALPVGTEITLEGITPSPESPTSATATHAPPGPATTTTPGGPEGLGDILAMLWEGARSSVRAAADAIADALSGLLP